MLLFGGRKLGPSWPVLLKKKKISIPFYQNFKTIKKRRWNPWFFDPSLNTLSKKKYFISKFWNASFSLPERYWGEFTVSFISRAEWATLATAIFTSPKMLNAKDKI
jgi:hypothetical protein